MDANVPLRGVGQAALALRDGVRIVAGRNFEPGRNEMIVGLGAVRAFGGLEVGRKIRVGDRVYATQGIVTIPEVNRMQVIVTGLVWATVGTSREQQQRGK